MSTFIEEVPTVESVWRAIILFGKNTASYKFALGRALLEFGQRQSTVISLEELAMPYARELARHLQLADKQTTTSESRFLNACRMFNHGEITESALITETMQHGFRYVLDAFHGLNQGLAPFYFFERTAQGHNKGIILTDALFQLAAGIQHENLPQELESRWRLVETAWELGLSRNLIAIEAVDDGAMLVVQDNNLRRVNVTSSRSALNGYQKGKCFYCFTDINLNGYDYGETDVDLFFPIR